MAVLDGQIFMRQVMVLFQLGCELEASGAVSAGDAVFVLGAQVQVQEVLLGGELAELALVELAVTLALLLRKGQLRKQCTTLNIFHRCTT